jgi:acyl-CoA synthetase (AMP-forming)/AMP-acid ligase II
VDSETDLPWRDPKTGLCQRVKTGEVGEFLVLLPADDIKQAFQGYFGNQKATESKILRDVFRKGDAWFVNYSAYHHRSLPPFFQQPRDLANTAPRFRSGDLMQWDTGGRLYFIDRIGDTFRWKSENVSTTEVSQALGLHPAVLEANVYGVQLPHHDGRAGCVAIVLDSPHPPRPELLASLAAHARETLPRYAVPLFLRLLKDVGMQNTGTHKQQKHVLRQQGVDPAKVQGDALFWLKDGTYVPFGEREWRALQQAAVKL